MAKTRINHEALEAFLRRAPERANQPQEMEALNPGGRSPSGISPIPVGALPKRWTYASTCEEIVFSEDGLQISSGLNQMVGSVCTDLPLPHNCHTFYFEVTITQAGGDGNETEEGFIMLPDSQALTRCAVGIGFNTVGMTTSALMPGWPLGKKYEPRGKAWGYHADDGGFFANVNIGQKDPARICGPGDTMGCGVDINAGNIWFTKNGERIGEEYQNVSGPIHPTLGWMDVVTLSTNFGATPFVCEEENARRNATAAR